MAEIIVPLELGFSTADAGRPAIEFSDKSGLNLNFRDWQEKAVNVQFPDSSAFSWVYDDSADEEVSEIQSSSWLKELEKSNDHTGKRHYRISFNAIGTLNVISDTPVVVR